MTISIKFKLVGKQPTENGTMVNWAVGVSDGEKTSTGIGHIEVTESIAGMSDDAVIQLALNKQGGLALVDELYMTHVGSMKPCLELKFFDDWYTAYEFACAKRGIPPDTKEAAFESVSQGFGTYGVSYNHSIYNVTTGGHWSHTFKYIVFDEFDAEADPENLFGGTVYHVKVRGGMAVEWYKRSAALNHNGSLVDWVSLDTSTGEITEWYKEHPSETDGISIMEKFNAASDELATSTVHGQPGQLALPQDFQAELATLGFEYGDCIFGYATKSYGKIIEYTLLARPQ